MQVLDVALKIQKKIELLEKARGTLEGLAADKALTAALYEKDVAVAILKLRNGKPFELEGETIKDPPATIIEKVARGICWESRLRMDQAEANYKLAIVKMDSVQAELNGWQSVNRFLDKSVT